MGVLVYCVVRFAMCRGLIGPTRDLRKITCQDRDSIHVALRKTTWGYLELLRVTLNPQSRSLEYATRSA